MGEAARQPLACSTLLIWQQSRIRAVEEVAMLSSSEMDDTSAMVSFLYGVAESLSRTSDRDRLKRLALLEAKDFLHGEYRSALEKLFVLAAQEVSDEDLRRMAAKIDRNEPKAEPLAAAAYLRARYLDRRRQSEKPA